MRSFKIYPQEFCQVGLFAFSSTRRWTACTCGCQISKTDTWTTSLTMFTGAHMSHRTPLSILLIFGTGFVVKNTGPGCLLGGVHLFIPVFSSTWHRSRCLRGGSWGGTSFFALISPLNITERAGIWGWREHYWTFGRPLRRAKGADWPDRVSE